MNREIKEYIDKKFVELYKMLVKSTSENWSFNEDNSNSIDDVVAEVLAKETDIDNLNGCVDDIIKYILKN